MQMFSHTVKYIIWVEMRVFMLHGKIVARMVDTDDGQRYRRFIACFPSGVCSLNVRVLLFNCHVCVKFPFGVCEDDYFYLNMLLGDLMSSRRGGEEVMYFPECIKLIFISISLDNTFDPCVPAY